MLAADSEVFASLNDAVKEAIGGPKNWDSLSMSDDTYACYQASDLAVMVEARYPAPVRIHSLYKYFSSVDTPAIPLAGRHSQANAVFGRGGNPPAAPCMWNPRRF